MAKIGYFVYCSNMERKAISNNNDASSISNPMPEIHLPFLPTAFSLGLAIGLADIADIKENEKHKLKVVCKNKEGDIIFNSSDMPLNIPPAPDNKKLVGMQIFIDMKNIIFRKNSNLVTSIFFDDKPIGEYETNVVVDKIGG